VQKAYRIHAVRGRDDRRVQEDRKQLDEHVDVEEEDNLFSPNRSVLGSDVEKHDGSQGGDVNEACCCMSVATMLSALD